MRERLFVDTWGWLNILSPRESGHAEVTEYFRTFLARGGHVFTTDYVLDESLTLLFKRLSFDRAAAQYQKIEEATDDGFLDVEWIGRDRFERAIDLRERYSDKPNISFTDLTSMVVMREFDLQNVLTGDAHFEHVGMDFRRQPQHQR